MTSLRYSQQQVTEVDIAAVVGVMRSDWLTCGPMIERFEEALAAYVGSKYAVVVSSGTAALHLAYMAIRGAENRYSLVQTSPLTFMATANAALLAGCEVSFRDVDRETGNVYIPDEACCDLAVPVHYAGRAAHIPSGIDVLEDACHALGAVGEDGTRVGSCAKSRACAFSFHPVKAITTLGEGGAVTTNDQGLADEVRSMRSHGRDEHGLMVRLGMNYRMTDAAAAMGIEQLKRCDEMRVRRLHLVCEYRARLPEYGMMLGDGTDAWHLYPIRIKGGRRDEVKAKLNAQGIGAQVHYAPIVPLHPYYRRKFGYTPGQFPEAEAWADEELSLPLHAGMTEADVGRVVDALRAAGC